MEKGGGNASGGMERRERTSRAMEEGKGRRERESNSPAGIGTLVVNSRVCGDAM